MLMMMKLMLDFFKFGQNLDMFCDFYKMSLSFPRHHRVCRQVHDRCYPHCFFCFDNLIFVFEGGDVGFFRINDLQSESFDSVAQFGFVVVLVIVFNMMCSFMMRIIVSLVKD